MLLSDYVLKLLEQKKIKNVFMITGGAIAFIVDAFSRNKKIKYTCVAHEQAAAMMADAYSRVGPNLGATMVTSGPGATNLITGIACSWFDSVPTIHISGQVNQHELSGHDKNTSKVRQVGFQETDIVSIVKPITKFAYQLKNENEIKYIFEKACHIAQSGRPGPVLIDIPMNLQRKKIIASNLKSFKPIKEKVKQSKLIKKINLLKKKLKKSKRPVIIIGGGITISKQRDKLKFFLKNLNIPFVTTWSGQDCIAYDNKNNIGTIGVYGSRAGNFTIQNSDFIINLGSRLDTRITGGVPKTFARNAFIASIDIDNAELIKERGLKINLKINYSLKQFFETCLQKRNNLKIKRPEWLKKCKEWKEEFPSTTKDFFKDKKNVNPYVFMDYLNKYTSNNEIIITDDGANLTWTMQGYKIKGRQRLISAFGNSPMGYSFPAAIGASIALKKKRIICIDGDGSLQINIQELQTMVSNKLPIKLIILNNSGYGIIKQFQELYLSKRYQAVDSSKGVTNPNFRDIAKAYKINYSLIINNKNIESILRKTIKSNKAEFIEVRVKPDQKIIPKLSFGKPIEDLSPLLSRKEFDKNMIIPKHNKTNKLDEIN